MVFCFGVLISYFCMYTFHKNYVSNFLSSIQVISDGKVETEKKIQEITDLYKIRIYYPYTAYEVLNHEISSFIQQYKNEFQANIQNSNIPVSQFYTLDIRYDSYSYQNFISYVFFIFLDTGGAHPNTYIHTITFDKDSKKVVTIESLMKKNSTILEILSKESLFQLQQSEKFQNEDLTNIHDMLIEGTRPIAKNFRNFAFSSDGLLIFFENYQVAPYVYGSFQVKIPYSKLNLNE